jgi:hypothetical protein
VSNAPKPCSHFESVALHNQRTTRKDCDEENLDSNRYAYRDVEQLPVKDAVPDSDAKLNKHAEIREKMVCPSGDFHAAQTAGIPTAHTT